MLSMYRNSVDVVDRRVREISLNVIELILGSIPL